MGIIDSLSAGYRFLFRRPQLLLIPVLLDLFLWVMPRLSIAALAARLAAIYDEAATMAEMPSDMVTLFNQLSQMLTEWGQSSNLFNMLVSNLLFHVPSLMTVLQPLTDGSVVELSSPSVIVLLALCFGILSIFIGVLYISLLAQNLPIGEGVKRVTVAEFTQAIIGQWLRAILFVLAVAVGLLAIYIPASIAMALLSLASPALGSLAGVMFGGLTLFIFFYLYFATVALVMDDLSIREAMVRSFRLVRDGFWPTLGFVVLVNLISLGFTLLLNPLAGSPPVGTLLAILGNAYIGTGLVLGLLVFYRTRHLQLNDLTVGS